MALGIRTSKTVGAGGDSETQKGLVALLESKNGQWFKAGSENSYITLRPRVFIIRCLSVMSLYSGFLTSEGLFVLVLCCPTVYS